MIYREVELRKRKVLILSDHALSPSGVGNQTRHLVNGLIQKGGWTFRQFGAAIKHADYRTVVVNEDFIIKPIDGFGNRALLREALATERPDALLIFTDPRFFVWLFEMEDEVHQICPIAWWHVWDNYPIPTFNSSMYEGTDLINCHSHLTYEMCKQNYPEKTNFIPHSLPPGMFYPMSEQERQKNKILLLGAHRADHFTGLWINRNARRKRPSDVIWAWKLFVDELEKKHGHRKATLIMHTDPYDQEGPNLVEVSKMLGVEGNVAFSKERVEFEKMNVIHNVSDFCINISYAEGFGLSTLEAMNVGNPIVAIKTGGLTRQVVNAYTGEENGVALPVALKTLVGSQGVPYIYEDYASVEDASSAIMKVYELGREGRRRLGAKAREYALSEFGYQKVIDSWDKTLGDLIDTWRENRKNFEVNVL
jgi:glycosyltransferase involved in cell wall biosynthesis